MTKILAVILSVSILMSAIPGPLLADRDRLDPAAKELEYAQREAESPSLEEFTGGSHGLVIGIVLIVALVVVVWYLIDGHRHHRHHAAHSVHEGCNCQELAKGRR